MYGEFINNWAQGQITHINFTSLQEQANSDQVVDINLDDLTLSLGQSYDIATGESTQKGQFKVKEKWHLPYQRMRDGTIVPSYTSHLIILADMAGTKIAQGIHQWPKSKSDPEFRKDRYVSHGCIRTKPQDILPIYSNIELGATVNIF